MPVVKFMQMLILSIFAVFVLACVYMYLQQDKFIFYPLQNEPALIERWEKHRVEIPTSDGPLEGWWLENPQATTEKVILYFGGNAEDVLSSAADAKLNARKVLLSNYRGYGRNAGKPSQRALFADALEIYDYAVRTSGVTSQEIVVMGRSLGSGVATYLASQRSVAAVVLITPYDSIRAVAQSLYPILPIRLLLKHPFPSDTFAPNIKAPLLIVAAEHDQVVPTEHARRLLAAWGGEKTMHLLADASHNDIGQHPDYYRWINEFLESK
jgi:pimeloyl-ACP methyl ester carboxylesterase